MQLHLSDILRYVRLFIMKVLNGFLMTRRQMTLKRVLVYNVRKLHRPRMLDAF